MLNAVLVPVVHAGASASSADQPATSTIVMSMETSREAGRAVVGAHQLAIVSSLEDTRSAWSFTTPGTAGRRVGEGGPASSGGWCAVRVANSPLTAHPARVY